MGRMGRGREDLGETHFISDVFIFGNVLFNYFQAYSKVTRTVQKTDFIEILQLTFGSSLFPSTYLFPNI